MKRVHTVVAVVGIAVAAGAAWWWQQRQSPAGASDGPAVAAGSPSATPGGGRPAGAGSGAAGGRGPGGAGGPVAVEVARAERTTLTDDVQAVGSLKSSQGVVLRPEVSGRVARLGFAEGQRVRRGQLLVQLEDTLQRAQLQQAEAQASIARTNLQRSRELQAQNFVSQSAVDQNASALQVAEAQVALAQAQLARMRVVAPFDGTAGLKQVEVGDYLKDGAEIVRLEDLSALTVQFALPERTIDRLRVGQSVDIELDALPGRKFQGRVQAVDVQVAPDGRALQVLARVDNPGSQLKPGMFARSRVVFAVRENAVVVPEEALVPLGTKQYVFEIVDGPDGRKVSRRVEARIGQRLPGKVEILGGIEPGAMVATAGQARLLRADSLPVRVIDVGTAAATQRGAAGAASRPAAASASGVRPAQP